MSKDTSLPLSVPVEGPTPSMEPYPNMPLGTSPPSQNAQGTQAIPLLPISYQHAQQTVTCYDFLGRPNRHGPEQRYLSPTTGACRRLIVQSVRPRSPNDRPIKDHVWQVNKLGVWLAHTNPFGNGVAFKWLGIWLLFSFKLIYCLAPIIILATANYFGIDLGDQTTEDSKSHAYNMGRYKGYSRPFRDQLWAARSHKEFSARARKVVQGQNIRTQALYPRVLMRREPTQGRWVQCQDRETIIRTKYIAISYSSSDMYTHGPNHRRELEEFKEEVRAAVLRENFDAYWLDLDCVGNTPEEKKLDLFCMADVYRGAEKTLIVLGKSDEMADEDNAWRRWGDRVWTFPEALLSKHLFYTFRGRTEICSLSLHQLANLAYPNHDKEQAIINAYSEKDPLERLERLGLLKMAIFQRDLQLPNRNPSASSPPTSTSNRQIAAPLYEANRVYALMGFFEHRIEPDYNENEMCALARLSMANDNDRIAERMVSLLPPPSETQREVGWYADEDIYQANLWDILPEVQVAGITETGALVLDGCRSACIRWKDFPDLACTRSRSGSTARSLFGFLPFLAWPLIITGVALYGHYISISFSNDSIHLSPSSHTEATVGAVFALCGIVFLLLSPWFFVFSEGGYVVDVQPWLIGIKGVLDIDAVAFHLYPEGNKGRYRSLDYTPSGSPFAEPEQGKDRMGSKTQYDLAVNAEQGVHAGQMYTLIDTCSATVYYFSAERPPTVCLFTGREGGMGRYVLCSEKCGENVLLKETVLRMPTEVSQWMELGGWLALK